MARRQLPAWVPTTVLALSGMVVSLQFTLTIPLLPSMPEILSTSPNDASWVVTATLLSSAVATPILSRMADMYGKRRMILVALTTLTVGSIVIGLGDSYATMITGRVMQGFGQSLIPIGISLLRDLLPKERIGSAVALMSATLGIGSALGMPLSGVLYEVYGWHAIFWFSAIVGAVFTAAICAFVRESPVRVPARFDLVGALLLSVVLTAVLLALSKGGQWELAVVLTLLGVAAIGLTAWIPFELRVGNPLVDLRTFSRRTVLLTNVVALFVTAPIFANMLLTVQVVLAPPASGYGFGMSITVAGLVLLPSGIVMVVISPVAGRLLNRWGGRLMLVSGAATIAGAFGLRVYVADSILAVVLCTTLVGVGTALVFSAMPALIMASVPLTETASANGVNTLARSIGLAATSAFVALVLSTMSVQIGGQEFLSETAMRLCFWLAAGTALIGAMIALFLPAGDRASAVRTTSAGEILMSGRVVLGTDVILRHPAIVTLMNLDGTPVDWSRADLEGRYSAVLPGPGRYLAVANAPGWAPKTHVVTVTGTKVERDFDVADRLSLSGRVTFGHAAVAGAIVAVHRGEGQFVGSARCDDAGRYSVPLPAAGPVVVTAIDPHGEWAVSGKVLIGIDSCILDIEAEG